MEIDDSSQGSLRFEKPFEKRQMKDPKSGKRKSSLSLDTQDQETTKELRNYFQMCGLQMQIRETKKATVVDLI
jgi:DNA-binding transcriptional regulator WhiA